MAKSKTPIATNFRSTKTVTSLVAPAPRQAQTVDFRSFIHGQKLAAPFTYGGFTFSSPYDPTPLEIIDLTSYAEPHLEDTWQTNGIALRPDGVFVQLPSTSDLCSVSIVPNLGSTAIKQLRIEWFDGKGMLIDSIEFNAGRTLPQHKVYTQVIAAKGVSIVALYSNEETPLCRLQAL